MIVQFGQFTKEQRGKMLEKNKLKTLEKKRIELIRAIHLCKENKRKTISAVSELNKKYKEGTISYPHYQEKLNTVFEQRTPEQWIEYYDKCIKYYNNNLDICEKEIRDEETRVTVSPALIILAFIAVLGLFMYFLGPAITGFAIEEGAVINITEINGTIITTQQQAVIGEPVAWIKDIQLDSLGIIKIKLPKEAKDIKVENKEAPVQEELEEEIEITITINENNTKYKITYNTEAPQLSERVISNYQKLISITGPNNLNYTNIVASTQLPVEFSKERIHLYRITGGLKEEVTTKKLDSDNNRFVESIEWLILTIKRIK